MARVKYLQRSDVAGTHDSLFDRLERERKVPTANLFRALAHAPQILDQFLSYANAVRASEISPKLRELAIIITARHWTAQFEWYAHRRAAAQAGLSEDIITAIANRRRPTGMQPDEEAVYNFATELLETKQVRDATFKAAVDRFGEKGVVDIIGVMGYYQIVSMLLNVDEYPLPAGVAPELK